ncbi:MAG TPA: ferredoxin [Streptosporangiaceae bacterium]|nr:ferredoxin [Streptosporangiaceae bacterium]
MKRIHVDRARCTGIGICESIAPAVFEVDDDGTLMLSAETVQDDLETVEEAVRSCPAMALTLVAE